MRNFLFNLVTTLSCLFVQQATAQTPNTPTTPKWGIEVELVAPFIPTVHIATIKATRTIIQNSKQTLRGDLLLGAYIRPNVKHDVVEKINEYLLTVGYRQYLIKGLHIEAQIDAGYAWGTKNKIDGKDYNNFALLGEINTGYIFHLPSKKSSNFYILPQFGVLQGLSTNIGPRGGKTDTFIQGKLLVGITF
jgi:hypothetical protein